MINNSLIGWTTIKTLQIYKSALKTGKYQAMIQQQMIAQKRLAKEIDRFKTQAPPDMSIQSVNQMTLIVKLRGPRQTFWEHNEYRLEMVFKNTYPMEAPMVKFLTNIFHPNVYEGGKLCLDILGNQWSPIYGIEAILTSIRSLLSDPNPDSPANSAAAEMYRKNKAQYQKRNMQTKPIVNLTKVIPLTVVTQSVQTTQPAQTTSSSQTTSPGFVMTHHSLTTQTAQTPTIQLTQSTQPIIHRANIIRIGSSRTTS